MDSGTTQTLSGVWGSSTTNVFVTGYSGTILHFDGNTWTPMETGTEKRLLDVWGSSPTDVYAVGVQDTYGAITNSTILHYDGNADEVWDFMRNGRNETLNAIWGSSDKDIFAVGDTGTILHYDGTFSDLRQSYWSYINIAPNWNLKGISGSSSSNSVTVGTGGGLRYDGNKWSAVSTLDNTLFSDVWVSSATSAFAVGPGGLILRYTGDEWSPMPSITTNTLNAVWGTSNTDVYAVGDNGTILHYDGAAWSAVDSGTDKIFYDIWGIPGSVIFVVGIEGTILQYDLAPQVTTSIVVTTTTTARSGLCPANTIYGENSPEAELLRLFRDEVLNTTVEGQEIIRLYYDWSPLIVRALEEDEELRAEITEVVDEILLLLQLD
jgi:hypothetical protein